MGTNLLLASVSRRFVALIIRADQDHVDAIQHRDIVDAELNDFVQPHPCPKRQQGHPKPTCALLAVGFG